MRIYDEEEKREYVQINCDKKINPKTYAKFMDKNFATDYLTDTNKRKCVAKKVEWLYNKNIVVF